MSSILIKNCRLINPKTKYDAITDIYIENEFIIKIDTKIEINADETFDASGLIATPGLMDIHAHVVPELIPICVTPDEAGVTTGVTTVCDAGSLGWENFKDGRRSLEGKYITDVFHFVHFAPEGEKSLPEIDYERIDYEKLDLVIENNKNSIVGIKVRAVENALLFKPYNIFKVAAEVAHKHKIPLMIHLGAHVLKEMTAQEVYEKTSEILSYLERGDILTHAFTPHPGGIINNEKPVSGLEDALLRGVLLDLCPGKGHLDFVELKKAVDLGFKPDLFGTDIISLRKEEQFLTPHFYSISIIASKLMTFGFTLMEVIQMATENVAGAINRSTKYGSVEVGKLADITLLKLYNEQCIFHDGASGNMINGEVLLSPKFTIKKGGISKVNTTYSNHRVDPKSFEMLMSQRKGR